MGIIYHLFFNVISLNYYNEYLHKNSDECWCSDNHDYGKHGIKTNCDKTCTKNSRENCGGDGALQVYKFPIIRKFII